MLPARPNQEVGVGYACKLHSVRQHLFINIIHLYVAIDRPAGNVARCLNNVPPAAVGNSDDEVQPVIAGRMRLSRLDLANQSITEASTIAHKFKSHIISMQLGDLSSQRLHK